MPDRISNRCAGLRVVGLLLVGLLLPESLAAQPLHDTGGNSLGRFFTTPRDRTLLDHARRRSLIKKMKTGKKKVERSAVTLNGYVVRSGGPPAVWVDGKSALVEDGGLPRGVSLTRDAGHQERVLIRIPGSDERISLKPGQRMDGMTGSVLEAYEVIDFEEAEKRKRAIAAKRKAAVDKTTKKGQSKAAAATPGAKSQMDRLGLGEEGAAVGEMMEKRDAFTKKISDLTEWLGGGKEKE